MPHRHAFRLVAVLCLGLGLAASAGADSGVKTGKVNPFGDCCVAQVQMAGVSAWNVTCGSCATNPGVYVVSQPDPEKLVFTAPGGIAADSPYDAAYAVCNCPSQAPRRAFEKEMRTYDGN